MAAAAILDFRYRELLLAKGSRGSRQISMPKFRQNQSIGCEYIKIFQFFKMAAIRHLGFVWDIFGPSTAT